MLTPNQLLKNRTNFKFKLKWEVTDLTLYLLPILFKYTHSTLISLNWCWLLFRAQGIRCVFKNVKHCRIHVTWYIYLKYFSIAVLDLHAHLMGPWMLMPHQLLRKRNKQNRRMNYLRSNWPTCYLYSYCYVEVQVGQLFTNL